MHNSRKTFVVVADGRRMLFFRNAGTPLEPNLELVQSEEQDNPADRDQSSDAPGRTFNSASTRRHAYEETDFHQLEEDRFAAETAGRLREYALNGSFDQLIVIAPPRTLGEIRKHYHKDVSSRLIGELDKDLTGHTVSQIERVVAGL